MEENLEMPGSDRRETTVSYDRLLIVYVAPWGWTALRNRSQPLAEQISKWCDVLYVDPFERSLLPPGWQKFLRAIPFAGARLQRFGFGVSFRQRSGSLKRLKLLSLLDGAHPHEWRAGSCSALVRYVGRRRHRYDAVWLLASAPIHDLAQSIKWDRILVDLHDPWLEVWDCADDETRRAVDDLMNGADLVFANGPAIADEYGALFNRTVVNLPNGIDDYFVAALAERMPEPEFMRGVKQKRHAVFAGNVNDRIDLALMLEVIRRSPEWAFFFIGREYLPAREMGRWGQILFEPNFYFVPEVPHRALPAVLQHADALLLPYTQAGGTKMFPQKLIEYLAAGKPVFSSVQFDLPEAAANAIVVCPTGELLARELRFTTGLARRTAQTAFEFARANTWETRATQFFAACAGDAAA
jgi:glycosyltransferase involved in cell wall biosynthesis